MIRLPRWSSRDARARLLPFFVLSVLLHGVALVHGPPRFERHPGDPDALGLVVRLIPSTAPAADAQPGPLTVEAASASITVPGAPGTPNAASISIPPTTSRGSGESSGSSIISAAPSQIESIAPFWAMHYGGAPGAVTQPPEVVDDGALGYPSDAPARARAARIVAIVIVGADGKVEDVVSVEGAPHFVRHATAALRESRFKPAERNGVPVRYYLTLAIDYVPSAPASTAAHRQ